MANPKSKVLPEIINVYLFIMLAHCADVFVVNLMGDSKAFGTNFYGHAVGLNPNGFSKGFTEEQYFRSFPLQQLPLYARFFILSQDGNG